MLNWKPWTTTLKLPTFRQIKWSPIVLFEKSIPHMSLGFLTEYGARWFWLEATILKFPISAVLVSVALNCSDNVSSL